MTNTGLNIVVVDKGTSKAFLVDVDAFNNNTVEQKAQKKKAKHTNLILQI